MPAFAAQKKWDGAGGNTDWITGLNWSPNNVPGVTDDVLFDSSIVSIPGSMTVNAGVVGAQSLTFAAGFNSSNTVTIGSGSASSSFLILGSSTSGSNALLKVDAPSGTVAFNRVNGGTAPLTLELAAATLVDTAFGATLDINSPVIGLHGIIKSGGGSLRLSGTNTFSGNTVVNQGTLALISAGSSTGSFSNSPLLTVMSGGALDVSAVAFTLNGSQALQGNGTVRGHLSAAPGAVILAGLAGAAGTLTLLDNLALDNATLVIDLSSSTTEGAGVNDLLISSNLTLSGNNVIVLNYLDGALAPGTYRLIKYNGTKAGSFTLGGSYPNVTLDEITTPNYITLVVGAAGSSALNLTWVGDGVANAWDETPTLNWLNGATPSRYFDPANVTFGNSGSVTPPINLLTTIVPRSVTVSAAGNYTIGGVGSIGNIPGLSNTLVKAGAGTLTLNTSNSFNGGVSIQAGSLRIGNVHAIPSGSGKGDVSISGTLDLNGHGITLNGLSGASSGIIDSGSGSVLLTVGANNRGGLFAGTVRNTSGSLSLLKLGTGTITLSGNSSFSGAVTIDDGALRASHASALGDTAGATTVSGAGSLGRLELSGGITVNENLVLAMKFGIGSGTKDTQVPHIVNISGDNTLGGAFTLTSGGTFWTLQSDSGRLIITSSLFSAVTGGRPLLLQGVGDGEIKSSISNGLGQVALIKSGTGTWTLSGTNTYAQDTTVDAGTLRVGNSNAIPSGAGKGDVAVDGTLDLNGHLLVVNGLSGAGFVDNNSPVASQFIVGAMNRSGTFSGIIRNTVGQLALLKTGTGVITLAGFSTYSGDTTVSQGTLKLGVSNVLPDGSGKGNVVLDATLDLNGNNDTINGLTGSGTITNSALTLATLTIGNNNASSTFNGTIAGPTALVKTGGGLLTLAGNNTATGNSAVNGGTLLIAGSIASTTVTVNAGATLSGAGLIKGFVTVQPSGSISLGGSIATLTISNNLALAGNVSMRINKAGAVLSSDRLAGISTLTYGGTLTISATGDPLAQSDTFNLFDAAAFSGAFASINLPALPGCLVWDTSSVSVDGTIRVAACPVTQLTVTGQIELQGFVATTRAVTFVATGGVSNKTWTPSLTFAGTPRVAPYTLLDVPPGTTGVSAKAAWNLRRKLTVSFSGGQATANFTGANNLLGGDIAGATTNALPNNAVNIIDYNKFRALNGRTGAAAVPADITGNGSVNISDYLILRGNLGRTGSAQ